MYTRYTYANYHTLPTRSADGDNLTNSTRSLNDYSEKLHFIPVSLTEHLTNLCSRGRKITILDCGAGSGKAIDDLLSGPYKDSIEKCVGISLHYFKNVFTLFATHGDKIEWILGPAEKILPDLVEQFDVIFDVLGAHFYSAERPLLVEQYHRLLKMGSQASIRIENGTKNIVILDKKIRKPLELCYTSSAPATFRLTKRSFIITKMTEAFPGEKYTLSKVRRCGSSIGDATSPYKTKKGNAWRPMVVYYRPKED